MSGGASPSGRPVRPPMPNIGRNASANSIGVVKRMDAPHNDSSSAVKMTTDGIEMIIVVTWKNELITVPMPVMNMWCAQTMNDMNPRKTIEYTSARYPQSGFRVLLAMISDTMPIAGRMSTYTSGWARSEEHTSELQSLAYLVCRLLL